MKLCLFLMYLFLIGFCVLILFLMFMIIGILFCFGNLVLGELILSEIFFEYWKLVFGFSVMYFDGMVILLLFLVLFWFWNFVKVVGIIVIIILMFFIIVVYVFVCLCFVGKSLFLKLMLIF